MSQTFHTSESLYFALPSPPPAMHRFLESFSVFLRLGLTSFGGPTAHLGFFHREFVTHRRWIDDNSYANLLALCHFLPGPASSQIGFAIGHHRGGLAGATGAFVGFTLPSALIMLGAAFGIAYFSPPEAALDGLKIAAAAVVTQAVASMAGRMCTTTGAASIALLAASAALIAPSVWTQALVLAAGMSAGLLFELRKGLSPEAKPNPSRSKPSNALRQSLVVAAAFVVLMAGILLLAAMFPSLQTEIAVAFSRTGALVFGGGHVVLPLLETETIGRNWLGADQFLAGYGLAQALPGPLFTFSAYLGSLAGPEGPSVGNGVLALLAIFLPGLLLVLIAIPHWTRLRHWQPAQRALSGANAAVTGLLLAALYDPVFLSAIEGPVAMAMGLCAFAALAVWNIAPWLIVLTSAFAGMAFLG